MTALFFWAWPYSYSFLKASIALFIVLWLNATSPFSNLLAFLKASLFLLSGRLCIFLKAITTSPALLSKSLLRKFLWIYVILLLVLNFDTAYLIWAVLLFATNPFKTFKSIYFCFWDTEVLIFSIVLIYLHLLKVSETLFDRFLNNWTRALYLSILSLF